MKPPPFDYLRPANLGEAVAQCARYGADAKILAGGQSLVPLLNFRLLRPNVLIDVNRLSELDYIRADEDGVRIGALTRHYTLETSAIIAERFPVVTAAMPQVAHLAIRNRGTIGGSLAHADPAAELPMLAVLLDAEIVTSSGTHTAQGFFQAPLTTALAEGELVTEVFFPALPPRTGWAFEEASRRHGDFALAAVAATVTRSGDAIGATRIAAAGVGETPLRLAAVEQMLVGQRLTPELARATAQQAADCVEPFGDLHASPDYRRRLAMVLTERALTLAWSRAE